MTRTQHLRQLQNRSHTVGQVFILTGQHAIKQRFGGGTVVASVMLESLVLALVGGLLGGAIAYLVFNGFHTATVNWQSFSQVTFAFYVTPQLLIGGIIWATVIGLIGGLFPAIRAARLPIAAALREL